MFIGSPGGLENERKRFHDVLAAFNRKHAELERAIFHPVGWEFTTPGAGRPQALINKELESCDYAVFLLYDRWGSATGTHSSGFHEEWTLSEKLYGQATLLNIALYFKAIAAAQLRDPGDDLKKVLAFRKEIEGGRKYLFKPYEAVDEFCDVLETQLAQWLHDHRVRTGQSGTEGPARENPLAVATSTSAAKPVSDPGYAYWIEEAVRLLQTSDYSRALFCTERAEKTATSDTDWARAAGASEYAQYERGDLQAAIAKDEEIVDRLGATSEPGLREQVAKTLYNKGFTLGMLGRSEEEVAVYDEVLARFGPASEPGLRAQVGKALVNKGITLGMLGRSEEAVAVYDEVLARFGAASEPGLCEQVAKALVNKGIRLGMLGRSEEEIAIYDEVLTRFGFASEPGLREPVAKALRNKGVRLGVLGRSEESIAAYDDVLARFATASEPGVREQVGKALVNKGVALGMLGRSEEAVAVYDEVLARFGAASEPGLYEPIAKALVNKGFRLSALERSEEAVAAYDEVLVRFGPASEPGLREQVARALLNKGVGLGKLGRSEEAVAAYDEVLARFAAANEPTLKSVADAAREYRDDLAKSSRDKAKQASVKPKKRAARHR